MATLALGITGAAIGGIVGGPAGARLGFSVGTVIGGVIESAKAGRQDVGRLDDLKFNGSSYGVPIPWLWGRYRTAGFGVLWWSDLRETSHKKGSKLTGTRTKTYAYSVDLLLGVCHGPITRILSIWANDTLIYDIATSLTPANIQVKLGSMTEAVITDMDDQQAGPVPAYRGRCVVYINDLDLTPYGNGLPNFSFLVENTTSYERLVLSDGPVAYYRFEDAPGLLADTTNNRFDLTNQNGTISQVASTHGEELLVSAGTSEQWRVVGAVPSLFGQQITAEGWFKYKGGAPSATGGFRLKYRLGGSLYDQWHLNVEPNLFVSDLVIQWIVDTGGNGSYQTVHTYSFARDTAEHHVVVVYDQLTSASKLYLDGALVDTQATTGSGFIGNATGQLYLKTSDNMRGDEVAVYDKALTAAQVTAHWVGDTTVHVKTVLSDIFQAEGLTGDQYDVSDATDAVEGFIIDDRSEARNQLEGMLPAYFTDLLERDGKLVALRRGGASQFTIDSGDLGAQNVEAGSDVEAVPLVVTRRLQELELPFQIDFAYISNSNGYQRATASAKRYTKGHLQNVITVSTTLVFDEIEARFIAERLLYQSWVERMPFEFSLPIAQLHSTPGDPGYLPVGDSLLRVRLVSVTMGLPGVLQFRAVLDDVAVLTQVADAAVTNGPVVFETPVTDTSFVAWNGNAGRDADADSIGMYVAANGSSAGIWEGGVLYTSTDAGVSYQEAATILDSGTFGVTASVLAAFTTTGMWDDTNTVDVTLTAGVDSPPETHSDAEVLAGANGVVIGSEYLNFGTVTSLGGNNYRLSHLLRGQRGTDTFWEEHLAGERVVFDDGGIQRVSLPGGLGSGAPILVKIVASGQTLADVSPITVYIFGRETREWAGVQIAAARDGGFNVTYSWHRRARKNFGGVPFADPPIDTLVESYQVVVLPATGTTITAITSAALATVTAAGHGLVAGDDAYFTGVAGLLHLNGQTVKVLSVSGNDVVIDLDTRGLLAYSGSGTVRKPKRVIATATTTASYTSGQQVTDFGSNQPVILTAVYAIGDDLRRGYPLEGNV